MQIEYAPSQAPQPEAEQQEAAEQAAEEAEAIQPVPPGHCFVLRLPEEILSSILQQNSTSIFLKWKNSLESGTRVCFVEACQQGKVVGTGIFSHINVIKTFAELRGTPDFKKATALQKQAWRNHILQQKKKLYSWTFANLQQLSEPLQAPVVRGKASWVSMESLRPHQKEHVPGPDLQETCEYFFNRLPKKDKQLLQERMESLDGCTISVGSTCSGTDICICLVKSTVKKLCQIFNVTRQRAYALFYPRRGTSLVQ